PDAPFEALVAPLRLSPQVGALHLHLGGERLEALLEALEARAEGGREALLDGVDAAPRLFLEGGDAVLQGAQPGARAVLDLVEADAELGHAFARPEVRRLDPLLAVRGRGGELVRQRHAELVEAPAEILVRPPDLRLELVDATDALPELRSEHELADLLDAAFGVGSVGHGFAPLSVETPSGTILRTTRRFRAVSSGTSAPSTTSSTAGSSSPCGMIA